jgi:hypothetical protein
MCRGWCASQACLGDAEAASGLQWQFTGRLGRRLRHQTVSVAQLVVHARSALPLEEADVPVAMVPPAPALHDPERLDGTAFDEAQEAPSPLHPLDQCLLLARACVAAQP